MFSKGCYRLQPVDHSRRSAIFGKNSGDRLRLTPLRLGDLPTKSKMRRSKALGLKSTNEPMGCILDGTSAQLFGEAAQALLIKLGGIALQAAVRTAGDLDPAGIRGRRIAQFPAQCDGHRVVVAAVEH